MLRCREYIRVSSRKQVRGASLDDQRAANARRAAQLGSRIDYTYVEAGESAFKEKLDRRVAFQQMLEDARARRFDVLIVYDLSRFSRFARVSLQIAADLERLGVQVISTTEYFDTNTAAGRMTFTMLAAAAQFKSDHLSERMKAIRKGEAERGEHVGPVPLGYLRVAGKLQIDETTAPAVRLFGELYSRGDLSVMAAVDAVQSAGYTLNALAAEEMISNAAYAGHVSRKGAIVVEHAHPAIWSPELWARISEVRQQRARRRTKQVQPHHGLLTGLAVCGHCGAPMWHHPNSRSGRYYHCASSEARQSKGHPELICGASWVKAEPVEQATLAWIEAAILTPDLLDIARRLLAEQAPMPQAPDVNQIEQKLKRLARAYADGAYDDLDYEQKRASLLAQLQTAPARPTPIADIEAVLAALRDIPALLVEATAQERRQILGQLVTGVYLRASGVLALRPTKIGEPLLFAAAQSAAWRLTNGPQCGPGGHATGIPARWLNRRPAILTAA